MRIHPKLLACLGDDPAQDSAKKDTAIFSARRFPVSKKDFPIICCQVLNNRSNSFRIDPKKKLQGGAFQDQDLAQVGDDSEEL